MKSSSHSVKIMKPKSIARKQIEELVIPYLVLCVIVLAGIAVYWILTDDISALDIIVHIISLIFGAGISLLYHYSLAKITMNSMIKSAKKAKNYYIGMFALRQISIFIVLALLIYFLKLNLIILWMPLLFPRIYYTHKAFAKKDF